MPAWLYLLLNVLVSVAITAYFARRAYGRGYDDGRAEQARLMRDVDAVLRGDRRTL